MNLDEQLHRRLKVRAAEEGTTVTSLVEQALRRLLLEQAPGRPEPRFRVPVLPSSGGLLPGVDLTSNQAVQELLDGELPSSALR